MTVRIGVAGVCTIAELRARGMSAGAQRHAVATGRLVRLRRGVYCDGAVWRASARRPADRHVVEACAAWLALGRRGWATGYSAAVIAGLPVPHGEPRQLRFSLPRRPHGRRAYPGMRLRTAGVDEADVLLINGVPVTAPARTALDVAREHGFAAGLVLADAALRAGIATAEELRRVAERQSGWPSGSRAVLVATHADGARESPAESVSYAGFVTAGLPLPACNAWIVGHGAGGVRADFLWRRHRLVGEVDGRVKYADPLRPDHENVLVDEKTRQLRIEEAGYVVVRWTAAEAMARPEVVRARVVRQSRVAARMYGVPPVG
ncbi:type IV toxin-antitoxin system AbiEi family antitoxin domain-containing protein [Jiangella sp. DSM 45060]|uniref:type IV toxin-antitoxin system AbiEi family antitoxin domain-containing protein n=1 Tax=Jiangella sp. DSM 45060 TaxID=1798224 RepID=UPI00087CB6F2|nr:type IV toxin-antitoxin system AbiEi family antitoxin domain-containing protein [Jiangella sp. DSM 45060]SDS36903.1 Transcriptional regulator, AbiEi antitoxin, Type IV TA system [Jiangella sp. DSM 45060]